MCIGDAASDNIRNERNFSSQTLFNCRRSVFRTISSRFPPKTVDNVGRSAMYTDEILFRCDENSAVPDRRHYPYWARHYVHSDKIDVRGSENIFDDRSASKYKLIALDASRMLLEPRRHLHASAPMYIYRRRGER